MKTTIALSLLHAIVVQAIRIVQGNDDGWAELYTRSFQDALRASGHDVVLACPAEDKSGSSSRDEPPADRKDACEYDSCPPNSGPVGHNATRLDLNWVNSFPVTAIKYGIDTFGPQLWDGAAPQLAVSGPNVGNNIWLAVPFSGTVAAAAYAASAARIPALAFSGADHGRLRWDTHPVPKASTVYARLAANLTNALVAAGKPYLPGDVFLNVNFPDVDDECPDASAFKWVLTRINPGLFSPKDVAWCGGSRLPTEHHVHDQKGCYISVSIGDARDKTTVNDVAKQQIVLDKLRGLLTCLPSTLQVKDFADHVALGCDSEFS